MNPHKLSTMLLKLRMNLDAPMSHGQVKIEDFSSTEPSGPKHWNERTVNAHDLNRSMGGGNFAHPFWSQM